MADRSIAKRLSAVDWTDVETSIGTQGYALTPVLLGPAECAALKALYDSDSLFRRHIDMARYNYGEGDYKYFGYPLPRPVATLRSGFYRRLAPIANRMVTAMGRTERYPPTLAGFRALCHAQGQERPTPLLLHYEAGGYNCLHRDLYGDVAFPLQAACVLSPPGDYEGGEFLLTEQRPRMQSRGEAIALTQGQFIVFPVAERPVQGRRGVYRAAMRHGVSRVRRGRRFTLGLIFHDAA